MHMADTVNTKRLVLMVPEDFHHQLKIAAATGKKDMRDIVVQCVSSCLKEKSSADVLALPTPKEPG